MRPTASAWAKTLLTVLLLVHLLIHPTLHALPLVAPAALEFTAPASSESDGARSDGRAPCLACRIGSSVLVTAVAAEPLAPNLLGESILVVGSSFPFRLSLSPRPSRAPPLAV